MHDTAAPRQTRDTLAARFEQGLQAAWFRDGLALFLWPLLPFSWLFGALSALRRLAYRRGWLGAERLDVPVIVVGNLIVGGAGKTPLTLWLVEELRAIGRRPGIVSRGHGGSAVHGAEATEVKADSDPASVGDEPLLLVRRGAVPVFVGRRRAAAGRALCRAYPDVDVLVCDDGLQHYALARNVELAVVDARGAGNGYLLPAGPLREPWCRLAAVDAVVRNSGADDGDISGGSGRTLGDDEPGGVEHAPEFAMRLEAGRFRSLRDANITCDAAALAGRPLYALAGIGAPERFFATLRGMGLAFTPCPFPDHHAYTRQDLAFGLAGVLLMTEKDAVKCAPLLTGAESATWPAVEAWVLPVTARIDPALMSLVLEKIDGPQTARNPGLPAVQGTA